MESNRICLYLLHIGTDTAMYKMGFPGGSVVKDLPAMQEPQETWVQPLGQEDALEKEMVTHSSILA